MASGIKKYSYDVMLELGTLSLGVKFPCKVGVIWESYMKTIQASKKPELVNAKAILSQSLINNFVLQFDMGQNHFVPRPVDIVVNLVDDQDFIVSEKGVREAGMLQFDFVTILNKGLVEMTLELPLQKCPDKNAKLSFTIKTILKQEIKSNVGQPNFVSGMMPDIVGAKQQQSLPKNTPTTDSFKKKVKIQQPQIINIPNKIAFPVSNIPPVPAPQTQPQFQPQSHLLPLQTDNYKIQRQSLLTQNKNTSALLSKAHSDIQNLRKQLKKALQQKQDLYAQIQSYSNQVQNLQNQNQQLKKVQQIYNQTQTQLITARTQLARIFNAATQLGGPALTDKLQSAIGIQQRSRYQL